MLVTYFKLVNHLSQVKCLINSPFKFLLQTTCCWVNSPTFRSCLDWRNPSRKSDTRLDTSAFFELSFGSGSSKIFIIMRAPTFYWCDSTKPHPEFFASLREKSRRKRRVWPRCMLFYKKGTRWQFFFFPDFLERSEQPLKSPPYAMILFES